MSRKPQKTKKINRYCLWMSGAQHLYFKEETLVCFPPSRPNKMSKDKKNISNLPTFNNDHKFYTLSFRLPSSNVENDSELILQHERRVQEANLQISDIHQPKPRSKQKYCGVCRGHYEDYKDHIQSQTHINFLKRSVYQSYICQFCCELNLQKKDLEQSKSSDLTCEQNMFKSNSQVRAAEKHCPLKADQ